MDDAISLQSVVQRFYGEVKHHAPTVPFVILGCKSELYQTNSMLREQAQNIAQKLNAFACVSRLIVILSYLSRLNAVQNWAMESVPYFPQLFKQARPEMYNNLLIANWQPW